MLGQLLLLLSRDYGLLDKSNKENIGYIVRQRARSDVMVDCSAARHESSEQSARRRPVRSISSIGARNLAPGGQKRVLKSRKQPTKMRSGGAKMTELKAVGRKRKPLADITHLFVNEREQPPLGAIALSASVTLRFV